MNDRTISVSFTGHRTYCGQADDALRATVRALYDRGFRTFLCGMAVGFDLAAGEAVVDCRAECADLQLVAVVPFAGQERRFSAADKARYGRLLAAADRVVTLAPAYYAACYAVRNAYLVEHAAVLVAWYDGSVGGTRQTVTRALKAGLELQNLCLSAPITDSVLF